MENKSIIIVKDVSVCYNLSADKVNSLKEYVVKLIKGKLFFTEFWAVKDVSINIERGEIFGIVGLNGAGKSTLLKTIAGVIKPTKGTVEIQGNIAPLIELGAGFDGELTGRENVFLNGLILGYKTEFLKSRYDEIVEFAELGEFMEVPIKNYSSGMMARLGFSIATLVKPDILIVDEILSVGDFKFQAKCEEKIAQLISGGTTVVMVSHNINQIETMCNRVLWIDHGNLKMLGKAEEVCQAFKNN